MEHILGGKNMKDELFIYYCKCLFQVYGIPVRILKDGKLQLKYELVPMSAYLEPLLSEMLAKRLLEDTRTLKILQSANMLSYGLIHNKTGKLSVLIGPSRATEIRKEMFYEQARIQAPNVQLPERTCQSIELYLNAIPIMQLGRFTYILSAINTAVQEKIVTPEQMQIIRPTSKFDMHLHQNVLEHFENVINGEIPRSNYYDYEKRLILFIRNGMTEQLTKVWHEATIEFEGIPNNAETLRAEKNRLILGIGIVTNAVLDCGIDAEDLYRQRALYVERTEACTSVREVINMRFNMMMDFCRRIEQSKHKTTNVPIVNYAIKYISDNIDKKISLQEVADAVHVSKSYLCAEFGKAMGESLFNYIQEQKIERAKQFLILTDKPLVEISSMLSFSSQSYFQKVFKQITGQTPKEFRDSAWSKI